MCDCCCDEDVHADVCPNLKCSYRMCSVCREKEEGRQQTHEFRCPACRVHLPRQVAISRCQSTMTFGVEQSTIVVYFPRCFWLRSLLRRCTMQRHFGYACQALVEFLAPVGMCSMTVAFVIFAGRLIFCRATSHRYWNACFTMKYVRGTLLLRGSSGSFTALGSCAQPCVSMRVSSGIWKSKHANG